jgi:para-nitrobenzyl esterase
VKTGGLVQDIVETTTGPVLGSTQREIRSFKGIPFAAAPFGSRRFLAPDTAVRWDELLLALNFGPTAPQRAYGNQNGLPDVPEPIIPGENILTLNVWAPKQTSGQSVPVLVWIHGGGFFAGGSANPWYDGESFARQGLVFVSVNYRLGAEGFLHLQDATSNRGVWDWIAALEWVKANVARFGGDPDRVTLMGQSAGGLAVSSLLGSPRAGGLFHQAIIASGVVGAGNVQTVADAEETAAIVSGKLGIPATRSAFLNVSPELLVIQQHRLDIQNGLQWRPVIDELVPASLLSTIRDGKASDIPILVGSTANEVNWIEKVKDGGSTESEQRGQALTDEWFRRPVQEFLESRAGASARTFRYEFQWHSRANPIIGAGHSLDIPFFFNNLDAAFGRGYTGDNPPTSLATAMHESFGRFALTGDPGWPSWHEQKAAMLFDSECRIETGFDVMNNEVSN